MMAAANGFESSDNENQKAIFQDLNAEDDPEVTEIESLCFNCRGNGTTKLLLTKIPFYKEVVIMSFCCENCHWENNELQPASTIQEKGVRYTLKVQNPKDLTRVVVKTDWASIAIPELEFEIPSKSQEGTVTNIEGIIERTCSGLSSKLEYLKTEDPDSTEKLNEFLKEMTNFRSGNIPFTFVLSDASGNSFLESFCVPDVDPQLEVTHFERSREECLMLGIYAQEEVEEITITSQNQDGSDLHDEVLGLPTNCYSCNSPCVTNMKITQIPHFKDVVIMATVCETCGHKTNEVKSGCGIEPYGVRATLQVKEPRDLNRDVLKSDSCSISIKEIQLEVGPAAFGSRYSTVEGMLTIIKEQLVESNPFITGDSADLVRKEKLDDVFRKIDDVIAGRLQVTFIIDDPCGNSYLQSIDYPTADTSLLVEKYERTMEQDEELGILDMKVEGYEQDS